MDRVVEETSQKTPEKNSPPKEQHFLNVDNLDQIQHGSSLPSSRRPSAILAALRRPSQAVALSAAHAVMNQRRLLFNLFHSNSDNDKISTKDDNEHRDKLKEFNRKLGDDALTTILSALYAKLIVVLGIAFPITEVISKDVQAFYYQGFYLYLYLGSILFVVYIQVNGAHEKAVKSIISTYQNTDALNNRKFNKAKYGSFYLRLGAIVDYRQVPKTVVFLYSFLSALMEDYSSIRYKADVKLEIIKTDNVVVSAFGIGSMVYSGLEFGRYFEVKSNPNCYSNILQAITPATRMVLTLVQVRFIFLNTRCGDMSGHKVVAQFGLMHMIATDLCGWLNVLVEETKHEIIHFAHYNRNSTNSSINEKHCQEGHIMGQLMANASPFLFPCKIEYSLICAVILFEMWKRVKFVEINNDNEKLPSNHKEEKIVNHYIFNPFGGSPVNSNHHFSVDCSNSHRGLFAGIIVIVLTIISLIMFFVLANESDSSGVDKLKFKRMAEFQVNIVELVLYTITTVIVIVAMIQMRSLKYDRKINDGGHAGIGLDNTLLVVAQTGTFIYCMFSIIGCYFTLSKNNGLITGLLAEIFSFIQTCFQTMLVLDGWWRRCRNIEQIHSKPGRQLITFLLIANMAMWTINTLEKNRASFRPTHLEFYGDWAWTIITHISMPLAIFYRFHSTICLFEIWKNAYKIKVDLKNPILSYL